MNELFFSGKSGIASRPDSAKAMRKLLKFALPISAVIAVTGAFPALAQGAGSCEFFKDKTVELIVPFAPGGGFDVYGRMVAKYMGPELGAANMIVRNQPGAGGLLGTNQTWAAKPDGLRIQVMSVSGMVTAELGGAGGVSFKSNEFSWVGRITGEPDVISGPASGSVKTLDDLRKIAAGRKVRYGSSGVGDIDYIEGSLLNMMLDDKVDVITGFSNSSEVYSSLGRGELDLFSTSLSSAASAEKAQTGLMLWSFSTKGVDGLPQIKPLSELVDAKFLPLIKVQEAVVAAGRAIAGPPKIPEDRLKCLRDAYDKTVKSEAFLAETVQLKRPVQPLNGQDMAAVVKDATAAPQEYVDILKKSFAEK
jgi:tripartite-type tricarboxylate transporter receptor subunit TctC